MKKTEPKGNINVFFVDYNAVNTNDILDFFYLFFCWDIKCLHNSKSLVVSH